MNWNRKSTSTNFGWHIICLGIQLEMSQLWRASSPALLRSSRALEICSSFKPSRRTPLSTPNPRLMQITISESYHSIVLILAYISCCRKLKIKQDKVLRMDCKDQEHEFVRKTSKWNWSSRTSIYVWNWIVVTSTLWIFTYAASGWLCGFESDKWKIEELYQQIWPLNSLTVHIVTQFMNPIFT